MSRDRPTLDHRKDESGVSILLSQHTRTEAGATRFVAHSEVSSAQTDSTRSANELQHEAGKKVSAPPNGIRQGALQAASELCAVLPKTKRNTRPKRLAMRKMLKRIGRCARRILSFKWIAFAYRVLFIFAILVAIALDLTLLGGAIHETFGLLAAFGGTQFIVTIVHCWQLTALARHTGLLQHEIADAVSRLMETIKKIIRAVRFWK
jgi:hypothetical protein